jgi:hypothetical protein
MSVVSTDAVAVVVKRGSDTSASDTSIVEKHVSFFTFTFVIVVESFKLTAGTFALVDTGVKSGTCDAAVVPEEKTIFTCTFTRVVKFTITSDTSFFKLFVSFGTDAVFVNEFSIGNAETFVIIVVESGD